MRRHTILFALLFPTLGALTALAIAIACGLALDSPYASPRGRLALQRAFIVDGRPWAVTEWSRPGATVAMWCEITRDYFTAAPPPGSPAASTAHTREDPAALIHDMLASDDSHVASGRRKPIPRTTSPGPWGQFASGNVPAPLSEADFAPGTYIHGDDFGYGWPCIALWFQSTGWTKGNRGGLSSYTGAFLVSGQPMVAVGSKCRVIPYFPVWPGLIINTAFYTALWTTLFFAARSFRRTLRKRRNRCERCNYDLRATPHSTPCPECGHRSTTT